MRLALTPFPFDPCVREEETITGAEDLNYILKGIMCFCLYGLPQGIGVFINLIFFFLGKGMEDQMSSDGGDRTACV